MEGASVSLDTPEDAPTISVEEPPPPPPSNKKKPKKIQDASLLNRPKWKITLKVEEDHASRPRKRKNSSIINGQWKGLTESEKRAWMYESDAADIKLAKLLAFHLREKVEYLNNPRYCRVPRVLKAFSISQVKYVAGEITELLPLDPPTLAFERFEIGRQYTTDIQVLNVSSWSQRIRVLLPSAKTFQVHGEDVQGKVIVPGQYIVLSVTFTPTTINENSDALYISSEMDSCQVILLGSDPLPSVHVPGVLNFGYCITGHSAAVSFPVASLGAACKFQLSAEQGELSERASFFQSLYSCQNLLYVPPFIAHPKGFSLCMDEATDIIAMFRPVSAGKSSQMVQISSDYGHHWNVLLEGHGTELKVEMERIDGRAFREKEIESGLWFGNATISSHNAKREITVKNSTLVALKYYWKIEPKGDNDDGVEAPAFSAQPCFGVLEPDSETSFVFSFCPAEIKVYKQRAALYVDTRHTFSLLAESWEEFRSSLFNADKLAAEVISSKHAEPVEPCNRSLRVASVCEQVFATKEVDNNGSIIKYLDVELIGVGDPFEIELVPPLLSFSDMLVQGRTYTRPVEIRNNTLAEVSFSWQVSQTPWVVSKDLNHVSVLPLTGKIGALGNATVNITVRATKIGLVQETLLCTFHESLQLPLMVEACVQGPRVSILQPMLDFGLVQLGTTVSTDLLLINKSIVEAPFKLMAVCEETVEPEISTREEPSEGASNDSVFQVEEVVFGPVIGIVPAKGTFTVRVDFIAKGRGQKAYAIICQVAEGLSPTQYALIRAFVDSPKAYFAPCKFDLGITFLYKRLTRTAILHNLTGLTTYFRWPLCDEDNVGDTSSMKVDVTPRDGELPPYGSQEITFRLTPIEVGEKELISICEIIGGETPIGVLFRTYISDFRCSYHILKPDDILSSEKTDPYSAIENLSKNLIDTTNASPLDFGKRCQLGVVYWLRLLVQNHTDIASKIHVGLSRYGTSYPPPLAKDDYVVLSALTGRPLTFPQAADSKSVLKTKKRKVPPLIDLPDEIHQKYWSVSGRYMVSRRLEVEMHNILIRSGEGLSLLVYPDCEGLIESRGQWCCDIFSFSCLPGCYSDILTCSVGGLRPTEIPVTVGVVGTPLYARPQHLEPRSYQHPKANLSLVLRWPPVSVGNPMRTKRFWVANVSPYPMEVNWGIMVPVQDQLSSVSLQPEDDSVVRVKLLGDPETGPVQVRLDVEDKAHVHLRFKEHFVRPKDKNPFNVTPWKQVIPARRNASFEVTFDTPQAGEYTFVLIGRTRIPDFQEALENGPRRPSRRVTFLENTEIIVADTIRRKSSTVTFSDTKPEVTPDPLSELIKITSKVGALNDPSQKPPVRRSSFTSEGLLLDQARKSMRTPPPGLLLQDPRPERRSSLKKASLQLTGHSLPGPERRSSLKRSSLASSEETRKLLETPAEPPSPVDDQITDYDPLQDPIAPIRVCLEALVFEPRLKQSIDEPVEFFCHGIAPLTDKSYVKLLVLKNEYSHCLTFSIVLEPPFHIINVEFGLLSSENEDNTLQTSDPESLTEFILPSEWTLKLTIHFCPEKASLAERQDASFDRELVIKFFGEYVQTIPVHAEVKFPAVRVLSDSIWFGAVDLKSIQTLPFSVVNASYFDTEWRLVKEELHEEEPPPVEEVPPPGSKKKQDKKPAGKKPSVVEVPSPVVVQETPAEPVIGDPFKVDVEGGMLAGKGTREASKQTVTVVFTPPEAKLYRQVFRVEAAQGRGCSLVMEGQGILEKPPEPVEEAPDPKNAKKGKK